MARTEMLVTIERSFLGICFADQNLLRLASRDLIPEDFVDERHRLLFEVACDLERAKHATDAFAIGQELDRRGILSSVGGSEYIGSVAGDLGADTRRFDHLLAQLSDEAIKRRVRTELTSEIANLDRPTQTAIESFDRIRRLLTEAEKRHVTDELPTFEATAAELLDKLAKGEIEGGIPTGYPGLDAIMSGGFKRKDMVVIAGATGLGKTSLATQMGLYAAWLAARHPEKFGPVLLFSFEMSAEQILLRLVLQAAHGDNFLSRRFGPPHGWEGHDREVAMKLIREIGALPFRIEDNFTPTVESIWGAVERAIDRFGAPSLVIVDYIGLLTAPTVRGGNRTAEVGHITRALKLMAQTLDIPVLALSQLNREVDKREDHMPVLSDLRESGSIAQDAALILFVHRAAYWEEASEEKALREAEGIDAEIIVAKNRYGPTGRVPVMWVGSRSSFVIRPEELAASGMTDPNSRHPNEPEPGNAPIKDLAEFPLTKLPPGDITPRAAMSNVDEEPPLPEQEMLSDEMPALPVEQEIDLSKFFE
jgi:replicative DNA helicase